MAAFGLVPSPLLTFLVGVTCAISIAPTPLVILFDTSTIVTTLFLFVVFNFYDITLFSQVLPLCIMARLGTRLELKGLQTPFQGTTSCEIERWRSSSSSKDKAKSMNTFKSFTSEITCKTMGFGNLDPQHGHQM